jgi:inner membrane protein involved in colicin E2 resistance
MTEQDSVDGHAREQGKEKAKRRLWYAAGLFVVYLIMYSITGGGPSGLLFGALMGLVSLAWIIFLVAGIYGLIKYR